MGEMMNHKQDRIIKIIGFEERPSCGGVRVSGRIYGYYFNALVFERHAKNPTWELSDSRISKLWIQRLRDRRVVYNWDRGLDVPPAGNFSTAAAVWYLSENLAEMVFGADSGKGTSTNGDHFRGGKLGEWFHFLYVHWLHERRAYYANMPRWFRKYSYSRKRFRRWCWERRMKAPYRD
jgi:ribosomal protein L32